MTVEHATSFYGVSFLATETVVKLCSVGLGAYARLIDKVIIKGCTDPLEIYSIDLAYMSLPVEEVYKASFTWSMRSRYRARQLLKEERTRIWGPGVTMVNMFTQVPEIAAMCKPYTDKFRQIFNMGYQNYS